MDPYVGYEVAGIRYMGELGLRVELHDRDWKVTEDAAAQAGWVVAREFGLPVAVSDAVSLAAARAVRERIEGWGEPC